MNFSKWGAKFTFSPHFGKNHFFYRVPANYYQKTLAFNKKIPFEIFWVCLKLRSFFDFEFIEKFY